MLNFKSQFLFSNEEITTLSLKKELNDHVIVDTNTQKVISKINQILFKHTTHINSKLYIQKYLYPTIKKDKIKIRQELFKKLKNTNFNQLPHSISSINYFELEKRIPYSFLTTDNEIYMELQDLIPIQLYSEKEVQELEYNQDISSDQFIISDQRYLGNIKQLRVNEVKDLIQGFSNYTKREILKIIHESLKSIPNELILILKNLFQLKDFNWDFDEIDKHLYTNISQNQVEKLNFIKSLDLIIQDKNNELKKSIQTMQLQLQGEDLINILDSNNLEELKKKLQSSIRDEVIEFENKLRTKLKELNFSDQILFSQKSYPLSIDEDVKHTLEEEISNQEAESKLNHYFNLSNPKLIDINSVIEYLICYEIIFSLSNIIKNNNDYPQLLNELKLNQIGNILIDEATPISYGLGIQKLENHKLNNEKVSILTGANSGGKTTLLELLISTQYLTFLGLPIKSENQNSLPQIEEIIYLKKFTGTQGSGAFEQTIKQLLIMLTTPTKKLILIDEFEAITEPGAAAKILTTFLQEISKLDIFCIGVSHLGKDILDFIQKEGITNIRIDGISAKGLDEKGKLITNHQPEFNTFGESTPELILQRIYQDSSFFKSKDESTTKTIKNLLEKMMNLN